MNSAQSQDKASASVTRGANQMNAMEAHGRYTVTCIGKNGKKKWTEEFDNLVTTQGKNFLLDWGLAGTATAVAVRMSFITSGTPVVGDTYASHAGFTELGSGVIAARGTPSFSAASAGVKQTASAVSAAVIGTGTVTGVAITVAPAAVTTLGTVGDTAQGSAFLYSAGLFGSSKSVSNGDTLNVTYSTTLT